MTPPRRTLGQKQRAFTKLIPRLIDYIYEMGYEATLGDAFRDPRVHGAIGVKMGYGHPNSAHKSRLAIDINLFKDGVFLQNTEDHKIFGEWWEKQDPDARWGGRFRDGNHYSFEHNGVK